jgi:transposase
MLAPNAFAGQVYIYVNEAAFQMGGRAMAVAKRRGIRRATVALARKLAIILHRMWVNGTDFRFGKEETAAA